MKNRSDLDHDRVRLYRSRADDARWVLRGRTARITIAALVFAAAVPLAIWQGPALSSVAQRIPALFTSPPPTQAETPTPTATSNAARDALNQDVGAATALLQAKRDSGVVGEVITATQAALAHASQVLASADATEEDFTAASAALNAATTALEAAAPPTAAPTEAPTQAPAPKPQTSAASGGGGSSNSGSGTNGTGGGGGGQATAHGAITCTGGTVKVTFVARATSGTVTLSVTGPADGSSSGTGSTSVTVTGPAGTYTASATGSGTVSVNASCG